MWASDSSLQEPDPSLWTSIFTELLQQRAWMGRSLTQMQYLSSPSGCTPRWALGLRPNSAAKALSLRAQLPDSQTLQIVLQPQIIRF